MFMPRLLFLAIGFLLLGAFSASDETAPVKDLPDEYIAPGHEEAMAAAKASTGSPAAVASTNIKADNVNLDALSDEQKKKITESTEKHEFQAEVNRLMDIIINSLYSQKEVFLREIISNSADALEKVRYLSVTDKDILGEKKDLDIRIEFDADAKTLSVQDSGVGMTKQELINNLGTVAKSGTTNFLEAIAGGGDVSLIGQFGVGFYSTFLVADRVTVTSKSANDDQHMWESTATSSFTVVKDPRGNTLQRGTRVTMHLKEDSTEFLSETKLRDLAKKYSQFLQFPIYLRVQKTTDEEVVDEEAEVKEGEEPKKKKVQKKHWEWEQVNTQKAIWLRSKDQVTEEEYNEFYKQLTKDFTDPMASTHFNAEGEIEFKSILYVPSRAPYDMFDNYYQKPSQIKIYVRRVLVADEIQELVPKYLNFIKGVVDSDDLPLNVSREQLQQNKILKVIGKKLVRKILEMLTKMAKDSEKEKEKAKEDEKKETKWDKFYNEFNKSLKFGCYEDDSNRSKIMKLLRWHSTKSEKEMVTLEQYVERMQEKQDSIFYISGESVEILKSNPHLQIYEKKGLEVLYLVDTMSEPCLQKMIEFEGKKFVSVSKGDVKIDETELEKKRQKKLGELYKPLVDWFKELIGSRASKVELSRRLVKDPCTVVSTQWGYSAHMEKVMKSQAFTADATVNSMSGTKIFELNPNHPVIIDLKKKIASKDDAELAKARAVGEMLFNSALLAAGYDVPKPADFATKLNAMVSMVVGVEPDQPFDDVDVGPLDDDEAKKDDDDEDDDTEGELKDMLKDAQTETETSEHKSDDSASKESETKEDKPEAKDEL